MKYKNERANIISTADLFGSMLRGSNVFPQAVLEYRLGCLVPRYEVFPSAF